MPAEWGGADAYLHVAIAIRHWCLWLPWRSNLDSIFQVTFSDAGVAIRQRLGTLNCLGTVHGIRSG